MRVDQGRTATIRTASRWVPRRLWIRLVILLGATLAILPVFAWLFGRLGSRASALLALPVGLAGLYFGVWGGIACTAAVILASGALLASQPGAGWFFDILSAWPAVLLVLLAGVLPGSLQRIGEKRARSGTASPSYERFPGWINATTENILGAKSLDDIYDYLVAQIAILFLADYAHLIRWDPVQKQSLLVAVTHSEGSITPGGAIEPCLAALTTRAMQDRSVQVVTGGDGTQPASFREVLTCLPIAARSALCIPLLAGEYEFGALTVAFRDDREFSRDELTYAELAGNQIALAIRATDQELKIEKRLKEANALANIERALSETEQVGLEVVLQLIVDSTSELIPSAQSAILHLLNEEQQVLVPRAVAGVPEKPQAATNMHPGQGAAGLALTTRQVIDIPDVRSDPRFYKRRDPPSFRSLVVAPIQGNERCVGTISIQSSQPNAFLPEDAQLLGSLGTQAAIAIANARLLETTQQDLKEINALYHISQSLAASLDPEQLMKDVVNLLHRDFGFYHAQIYTLDAKRKALVVRQASSGIGAQLLERGYQLPLGMGIIGHVAETGEAFVTNNVEDVIFHVGNPLLPESRSEMTIPIKIEGQVLGVLDIQQAAPKQLTQRQMQLMQAVADQLAVALQKANLYGKLENSLHHEKAMRGQLIQSERLALVGRLLASVSHELNNPIQAIQNALFLIKQEETLSAQGQQDLEIVLSESTRMAALLDRLRSTYRPTSNEDFQPIQLNSLIEDIRALTATHMRHKRIQFEFQPDPKLPVISGIPEQVRQVILNLTMNAIEAMPDGGCLTVAAEGLARQKKVLLTFRDTGKGIDPELLPHIFEPFVTNKESGTGLGLTITYDIIRQHNGEIQAENHPEGGASIRVWLPVKKKE